MPAALPLTASYRASRDDFLERALSAGGAVQEFRHPQLGDDGEPLAIDIAWIGPKHADRVVVIVSGTHGVEGYAGSALQRTLLRDGVDAPSGVGVCLVHALNPVGFAEVRRVNEDNVDLNRNFPRGDPPGNADYDEIADLLVPEQWDEGTQAATTSALLEKAAEWGFDRLQQAASGGQYAHPTGVFYGGTGPAWSHERLVQFAGKSLAGCTDVAIIDLHTGLGPWGHGELIASDGPGDAGFERACEWYGEVTSLVTGDSVSAQLAGEWLPAIAGWLTGVDVTGVALEYGTVDPVTVLQALRADAWLHAHGDPDGPEAASIRAQVRAAFADDAPEWIDALHSRFVEVLDNAYRGIAG